MNIKLYAGLLLACFTPIFSKAQTASKTEVAKSETKFISANNCNACDSLGDAYLFTGDTSKALYYYELFLEANPKNETAQKTVIKFRRLYTSHGNSFYLKEY